MTQSIAVAHKDYDVRGGGEVLAERLAQTFDCPLYVGRKVRANQPSNFDLPLYEIDLTWWQRAMVKRGGTLRSVAYMLAWSQGVAPLTDFDTLILSGNEPLWYTPTDRQTIIAYTHSTPRYQTDLWNTRDYTGPFGRLTGLLGIAQKTLYHHNIAKPDHWVANSDLVARRMEQHWAINRDEISVVYPPVPVEQYGASNTDTQDFYLYLGRLAKTKRVPELVRAFSHMDRELVVAGDGPERETLETLAGDNVDILGYVSEQRKRELLSQARALIFPAKNEDFGIVPIESMASGTPVIGVDEGFTREQIQDGKNGYTYERGSLGPTLNTFENEGVEWNDTTLERYAEQFCVARFEEEMQAVVEIANERTRTSGSLEPPRTKAPR